MFVNVLLYSNVTSNLYVLETIRLSMAADEGTVLSAASVWRKRMLKQHGWY